MGEFRKALASYRDAKAAYRASRGEVAAEAADQVVMSRFTALQQVPAATFSDVHTKLEIILSEIVDWSGGTLEAAHLQPVLDDLRRLAGGASC